MTPEKSHALIQEWRKIVAERKSVDFRMARWAHETRAQFTEDESFFKWLEIELGLSNGERVEALNLARSFKVVPDEKTWVTQGAAQIRRLIDLPKREQAIILAASKVQNRKIGAVLKSRTAQPAPEVPGIKKIIARFVRGLNDDQLADLLAEAIADQIVAAPANVLVAAKRHASFLRRK